MPKRTKKSIRYVSKYEDQAVLYQARVLKIDYQNLKVREKLKTFFYTESKVMPEGRPCVQWGRNNLNVGDEFIAKGRLSKDGVFLIWSLMIIKRKEPITDEV